MKDRNLALIVDDSELNRSMLADILSDEYDIIEAENGLEAISQFEKHQFDISLVLLDIVMPEMDGFEVLAIMSKNKWIERVPVIIISALADDIDKVRGLGLGADDYMTKPFSPSELVARVKGHIQRYQRLVGSREKPRPEILKVRGLEIDRESRRVWVNGKEVNMTSKEYDLLLFLAEHPDTVFSKDRLFDHVWGMDAYGDVSTITVHIKHIRDKIELNPDRTQYIETVWGVGYRFRG